MAEADEAGVKIAGVLYLKGQPTGRAASSSPSSSSPSGDPLPLWIQSLLGFTSKDYALSAYSTFVADPLPSYIAANIAKPYQKVE